MGGVPPALEGAHRRGSELKLTRSPTRPVHAGPTGGVLDAEDSGLLRQAQRRAWRDRALHGELRGRALPRRDRAHRPWRRQSRRAGPQARAGGHADNGRVSGAHAGDRRRLLRHGAGPSKAARARQLHGHGDGLADHAGKGSTGADRAARPGDGGGLRARDPGRRRRLRGWRRERRRDSGVQRSSDAKAPLVSRRCGLRPGAGRGHPRPAAAHAPSAHRRRGDRHRDRGDRARGLRGAVDHGWGTDGRRYGRLALQRQARLLRP